MRGEPVSYILEEEDGTRIGLFSAREIAEMFGCTVGSVRQSELKGCRLMKRFYVFREPDEDFIERWGEATSRILEAKR